MLLIILIVLLFGAVFALVCGIYSFFIHPPRSKWGDYPKDIPPRPGSKAHGLRIETDPEKRPGPRRHKIKVDTRPRGSQGAPDIDIVAPGTPFRDSVPRLKYLGMLRQTDEMVDWPMGINPLSWDKVIKEEEK